MSENDILPRMMKDHCKLEDLLIRLEKASKGEYEDMVKVFHKFEWELEKHIFTEEKAIFISYNPEEVSQGYKMLPTLTKQHNVILNNLNNWREDIKNRRILKDIYGFKEFMIKHKEYEEKEVYPKLDEGLSDEEKKHIVDKIDQIVTET